MTRNFPRFAAIALLAIGCGAASAGPENESFTAGPYATLTSDAGQLTIELRTTSDQPPSRGTIPVELVVSDRSGKPLDDLTLLVVPFMPAMGHGASVQPMVEAKGNGHYVLSNVNLFMPGRWELRTTFSGRASDHAAPALDVQ